MEMSDDADSRAFLEYMRSTTGAREASWDTFAATFETYMRRHYADTMTRVPSATPVEMVLRYAFDRGDPARAAASERVRPRQLALFLRRFGPMKYSVVKAARSLFDDSGCLSPWFHGSLSRHEADRAIDEWEACSGDGGRRVGVFLFRYSDRPEQPAISFTYRPRSDMRVVHCLIHNGSRGYRLPDADRTWEDLREFVGRQTRDFVYPIPSSLYLECKREIEARHQEELLARAPGEDIDRARRLFREAQTLVYSDLGEGARATRVMEKALGILEEVVWTLQNAGGPEAQLHAKALRLSGDILWKLRRQDEGVQRYLGCLGVVSEAQEFQDAAHEGSPVVTTSILSQVHRTLAEYFLHQMQPDDALDHFSELMACTTDENAREQHVADFRQIEGFAEATSGATYASVEAMLDEGISYFRRLEYEPAGEKFDQALRDARCIGEGSLEARALGNRATVDYKTRQIPAAIRRYRTCVQLLRQQGNQATERKILNYLVMCCTAAQRWAPAKRFHRQLSKLAESEDNIRALNRLEARIQEGMEMQNAHA